VWSGLEAQARRGRLMEDGSLGLKHSSNEDGEARGSEPLEVLNL